MVSTTISREWLAPVALDKRPRASYRQDLINVWVGMWLTIGVFIDGWAHNTQGNTIESFFTPWHAIFYSGFLACAAWIGWLIGRQRARGRIGLGAVPLGYGLGALGIVVFGLGGIGDMTWHTVFGIETGLKALLSPTHLMLFLGAFLILTSPVRAAWTSDIVAPSLKVFLPPLLSMLAAACFAYFMGMFFWSTLDAWYADSASDLVREFGLNGGRRVFEMHEVIGINNLLLTNALLLGPLFFLLSRWRLPFGTATILFGVSGLLMQAVDGIHQPEQILITFFVGLLTDGLVLALRAQPGRTIAFRVLGAAVPLVLWSLYFLAGQLRYGIEWPPEIWTGGIVLAMLSGVGLSLLAAPPPSRIDRPAAA